MEQTYPVLPLRNFVLFPGLMTTIQSPDPYLGQLLKEVPQYGNRFLVSLMIREDEYFYQTCSLASIEEVESAENGLYQLTIRGLSKFFVEDCPKTDPIIYGQGKALQDYYKDEEQAYAQAVALSKLVKRFIFLTSSKPESLLQAVSFITDPNILTNFCCHYFMENPYEKQEILQILDVNRRLKKVDAFLNDLVQAEIKNHEHMNNVVY